MPTVAVKPQPFPQCSNECEAFFLHTAVDAGVVLTAMRSLGEIG